jgi:UDP-2,3-diacylglucosamine pyrophosphatase LpxH
MLRYVMVLSDIHLATTFACSAVAYRDATHAPDLELARTIDAAVARARRDGAALEIVLAGDILDLDAPCGLVDIQACGRTSDIRSDVAAAVLARAILCDHPGFVLAIRRAAAAGTRVVILPGNHDAQVVLPSVREALQGAFGTEIVFRSWLHRVGPVLVEHGQQYDPLCVVTRLGAIAGDRGPRVEATAGTVSSFYGPLLFTDADPFATDPFRERRAVLSSLYGTAQRVGGAPVLRCLRELITACGDRATGPDGDWLATVAAEIAAPVSIVERHAALAAPKADLGLLYSAARGALDYGADVNARIRQAATVASDFHGARAVVVGHTHAPLRTVLPNGAVLVNAGTWAERQEANAPLGSFAWLAHDGSRLLSAEVVEVRRG